MKVCFYVPFNPLRFTEAFYSFTKTLINLNKGNLFQISMDRPNVNLKSLGEMKEKRIQSEEHLLIDIGSCGFYIIHGAFKTGVDKTVWNIIPLLKGRARQERVVNQTGFEVFPPYFCATSIVCFILA